ncbi:MAG TPA: hypothetical protein VKT77_04150 [Chthonomonadaceae bacterium]|nr:hypothetical protein [Chthonomonadaceae bacterium]
MDDQTMREALLRKLSDPQWRAEQERRYRQIVGEAPAPALARSEGFTPPPRLETIRFAPAPLPAEPEPDTIEALWNGNWQRSAGALTITRFPDDSVALDHPDGARTLFSPCPAPRDRFSWLSDTVSGAGRPLESYRCADRYEDAAEALLEMHRAALAIFAELRAETEA